MTRAPRPEQDFPLAGSLARGLALLAMLVQVLFYADHIGAMAAKTLGTAGLDARLGFMEICTGNGVEVIAIDGTVSPAHACPICENASVMGFDTPAALPCPDFPFVSFAVVWALPAGAHAADTRFPGEMPIRAPPVAIA